MACQGYRLLMPIWLAILVNTVQCYARVDVAITMHYRRQSKKCLPVFNCSPGYEIRECRRSGEKETCIPCRLGQIQPSFISSVIISDTYRTCFPPLDKCNHNAVPTREMRGFTHCECDVSQCWYGKTGLQCNQREEECPPSRFLDISTGECVPCPDLTFKVSWGCGPCRYNKTAFWQRVNPKEAEAQGRKTTNASSRARPWKAGSGGSTGPSSDQPVRNQSDDSSMSDGEGEQPSIPTSQPNKDVCIGIVIATAACILVITAVVGICVVKRRSKSSSSTHEEIKMVQHPVQSDIPLSSVVSQTNGTTTSMSAVKRKLVQKDDHSITESKKETEMFGLNLSMASSGTGTEDSDSTAAEHSDWSGTDDSDQTGTGDSDKIVENRKNNTCNKPIEHEEEETNMKTIHTTQQRKV